MTFTDDDLKHFKTRQSKHNMGRGWIEVKNIELDALLARLEAAECWAWALDPEYGRRNWKFIRQARTKWRQAAGK